jgi:hypothetical protein
MTNLALEMHLRFMVPQTVFIQAAYVWVTIVLK